MHACGEEMNITERKKSGDNQTYTHALLIDLKSALSFFRCF